MAFVIFNLLCVVALVGPRSGHQVLGCQCFAAGGRNAADPPCGGAAVRAQSGHGIQPAQRQAAVLIVATSAALLLVAYWLFFRSRNNWLQQAALILVLGGGIGNLIDRVLNGEVVDYINLLFMRFAVFNFADICVCVGVALWVLVIFLEELHEDTKKGPKEQ